MSRSVFLAAVLLVLSACGHIITGPDGKPYDFAVEHPCPALGDHTKVEVRYLGSGSVYLRWRDDALLLGASFSNPGLVRAGLWRAKFDEDRINESLRDVKRETILAILAGHSHYDHIGDIPEIATENMAIWVNASGANMLAPYKLDVHTIEAGKPIVIGPFTVRAVPSDHAPQLCPWRRFPCVYGGRSVEKAWTTEWPRHLLRSFEGGEPYAFVVEIRDGDALRFRLYYNDAAAASPHGQVIDDFDLAILTMAQWNWVRDYPRDLLLTLQPRHVMVSHWDDFFRKGLKTARFVPNLSNAGAKRFLAIIDEHVKTKAGPVNEVVCGVEHDAWTMPVLRSSLLFEPRP